MYHIAKKKLLKIIKNFFQHSTNPSFKDTRYIMHGIKILLYRKCKILFDLS